MTAAVAFKPAGYNSVAPYLIVDGAGQTRDFLVQTFDAEELRTFSDAEGRLIHAEMRVDDSVIMFADATPNWPALPTHVHIYVDDVDAAYRRALAAGAHSVQEPTKGADEDRRGGVKDAGGTTWWIATRVE